MSGVVLGLAGRRGSGKTTLASALQARFGFVRVSFGDHVRSVARGHASPEDTASLQALGTQLIGDLGWERFCRGVLADALHSPSVVVDGLRHVAAAKTLRMVAAPGRFLLVFVDIDEAVGRQRIVARARLGDVEMIHEMTNELAELREAADLRVDGGRDDAADRVARLIEGLGVRA
jgi:adenylate kinase family enzyme